LGKPGRKRLKPSGKPEGSDKPIKRAVLDSLPLKRWGERWGSDKPEDHAPKWIHGEPLEPRRKRRGSDKPCGCLRGRIQAALLEPRHKRRGSDKPKDCAPMWIQAARLEPRRKRRGSDQPIKRAGLDSVLLKPGRKRLKPSGKPEGSDEPIKCAVLGSVRLKCWGERWGSDKAEDHAPKWIHAAPLEPRRKRRGSNEPCERLRG
jgi:hypothetical protein